MVISLKQARRSKLLGNKDNTCKYRITSLMYIIHVVLFVNLLYQNFIKPNNKLVTINGITIY